MVLPADGPLSARAETIARAAHAGQVDKTGAPYIDHPRRVAARVEADEARAVAWLHDVVEDTAVTLDDLAAQFPAEVVQAVRVLTRRDDDRGEEYYRRVRANPLALAVKLADIADNTDPARQADLDPATRRRLAAKYRHARAVLTGDPHQ
jgi:(p)ppGpp synthase/HD superfamily hydrolase